MKPSRSESGQFVLDTFVPFRLNQIAEMVSKAFQACYQKDFDLTRTQWRVLAHLGSTDGLTAKDIATRVHEDKVSISRGVAALEARGLLRREPIAEDRRFERLSLTESGRDLFGLLAERARHFEQSLAVRLGPDLAEQLRDVLDQVGKSLAED